MTDDEMDESAKHKEIYTYETPWTAYAMALCRRPHEDAKFKMAVASYREEYSNQIKIVQLVKDQQTGQRKFRKMCEIDHPYPPTKVLWAPSKFNYSLSQSAGVLDVMATTGDYLRLWTLDIDNVPSMKAVLNNNKHTEYCAPLTSMDWSESDPTVLGTSSIDTTCTIWDISVRSIPSLWLLPLSSREILILPPHRALTPKQTATAKTQLIAHDREVFDIAFSPDPNVFGTVGADGSLRRFDLRSLEHSTILYESPDLSPLLRLAWNMQDPNYLATIPADENKAIILDVRIPSTPVAELVGHDAAINGIAWAPYSPCHICTVADDKQALIWDITARPKAIEDPILAFSAREEINNVQWCNSHEDWVAIAFSNCIQMLRV
jgi:WD repeat-containing protein 68